jgi:rifampicin phosphotransferase
MLQHLGDRRLRPLAGDLWAVVALRRVTFIRTFAAIDAASIPVAGGKAANLGEMSRAGFPVPPGFCITTQAYAEAASAVDLHPLVAELADAQRNRSPRVAELSKALRSRLLIAPIPQTLFNAIAAAYQDLGDGAAVAVRSSATAEDLADASFAGQQDTYLNVVGIDAICDAVRRCWASLWNDRAVAYRADQRFDHHAVRLAVVVQRMAPAEVAGVLFTADPVTGRRRRIVINASYGLGEAVVAGLVNPDHFVVEHGAICERHLGDKRIAIRPTANGTMEVALPDGSGAACLNDSQIAALADLGRKVEDHYGLPQDVEFAFDSDGRLWLLQARPITALPPERTEAAEPARRVYSRRQRAAVANIRDHVPLAVHPFDYSIFLRPMFTRMLKSLPYLGFAPLHPDDMIHQAADGVYQIVPPNFRPTVRVAALPFKIILAAVRADPEGWLAECQATLVSVTEETERADLATFSDAGLLDRIELISERTMSIFPKRFANLPGAIAPILLLPRLIRLAAGRRALEFERRVHAAIPCMSFQANEEITRLGRQVRESDRLRAVFSSESPERIAEILKESTEGQALLAAVEAYLRRYGLRETSMPGAAHTTWRDEPRLVYGLLKGFASAESGAPAEPADVEGARRELVALASSLWLGFGRLTLAPLLDRLVMTSRRFIAFREDSHYFLFMPNSVIRRLALELGRRLVRNGILDKPDDIFFLRVDEIRSLLNDRTQDVGATVRRRRVARGPGDGRFTSVPNDLLEQTTNGSDGSNIRGESASSGQAVGRARIIRGVDDFASLQPGEVLVAPFTNPTWTPLFELASAVVVDAGGMASHAAIVAREHRIPAVMGTGNATTVLRNGQRVLVDGDRGLVTRLGNAD